MGPDGENETKEPVVRVSLSINIDGVSQELHAYGQAADLDEAMDIAYEEAHRTVEGQRTSYAEAANRIGAVL